MNGHLLGIPERIFVEEERANTRDKVAYMKLSVLVMLDEGLTQEMTATLPGIGLGTLNKCKQKYENDGLDKYLDKHHIPYSGKLTDEQLAMSDDQVSEGMYNTCSQTNDWIENNFGFRYSESGLRSILHKLDFSYKKTTSVPGGLDSVEQAAFLTQLEPFLAETDPETEVVCFMDAVHPQHNTTLRDWLSKNPKIQIIHLPPYAPNLILMERLWKFMRKKVINLHYYRKFDDFRRAILDFFQNIEQYKWDLESLITPNFQRFSASPGIR